MEIRDRDALEHPAVAVVLTLLRADLRTANEAGVKARARLNTALMFLRDFVDQGKCYTGGECEGCEMCVHCAATEFLQGEK